MQKENHIAGLYCYLRQLALSLDRRERNNDKNLKLFFEKSINPKVVLSYYENYYDLINLLKNDELKKVLFFLEGYSNYLENLHDNTKELKEIRMGLSLLCLELEKYIPVLKKEKLDKIEHYNQNEILKTYPLIVLVPEWTNLINLNK